MNYFFIIIKEAVLYIYTAAVDFMSNHYPIVKETFKYELVNRMNGLSFIVLFSIGFKSLPKLD